MDETGRQDEVGGAIECTDLLHVGISVRAATSSRQRRTVVQEGGGS